jgi:hypothetical protein
MIFIKKCNENGLILANFKYNEHFFKKFILIFEINATKNELALADTF